MYRLMKMSNLCYHRFDPPNLVIRDISGKERPLTQKLYYELKNNRPYKPLNKKINGILVSSIYNTMINDFRKNVETEFYNLFKQDIQLQIVNPKQLDGLNFDIIIWVVQNEQDYQNAKSFKKNPKLPVQIVRYSKINDNFAISNICLNVFCKLGGVPWIIETNFDCYVVGIVKKIIGKGYKEYRVKLFKNNGLLIPSFEPNINLKDLKDLKDLLNELKNKLKDINKISFHFRLKPSKEEISAIEEIFKDKEYAIIYINLYSIFRTFDTSNKYYIPKRGLFIRIRKEQGLILSDGLVVNSKNGLLERRKPGFPHVLDVEIKKSTINSDEYEKLFKQVYHFCYVNYKSLFHFPSTPASII